ncbi:hypothetical protein [Roseateles saccharophilus]|uniref:ISXO2 transposase-like protein n=1 Tax=Roseateles saccharophilus TaxID=304 RepID=A0A4R3U6M9_ROSSA|nr:hypothetical protein EV671_10791 [Roseateles saccharophilus]
MNTTLGNLKTNLRGVHHSPDWAKHAGTYLAAFAYRFNRRSDLRGLLARPIMDAARYDRHPIRAIRGGAKAQH